MDVEKAQTVPPLIFFGTMRLFQICRFRLKLGLLNKFTPKKFQ